MSRATFVVHNLHWGRKFVDVRYQIKLEPANLRDLLSGSLPEMCH